MNAHGAARAAAILLWLEAVAIAVLVAPQVSALAAGEVESGTSAIALAVLTAVGAVAVAAFGFAVARGQSWGRSGGIVTQLLILAVALGAVTGAYAHPLIGLALAVPAIVVFALLVLAARRAGVERQARDEASGDPRR
ncbi:histidine kinase [Microbacterium sp. CJ88]|uniref:histidine kinase n=1 Tax=Microbacterium sp. CJ88 TaxID=3445672 RepID=UPI003F65D78C